jgi:hypothetical protein
MKVNLIVIIFLFSASNFVLSQSEEVMQSANFLTEQNISTTIEGPELARNPAMTLIEKNGGLVFAEVTLKSNMIHVFLGKENNDEFDLALDRAKKFTFIRSIEKFNLNEIEVEFTFGVTDDEQRYFYEKLGYSGFTFKTK